MEDQKFIIKLSSGRILGPIDAKRIALLILKNQILGTEPTKEEHGAEWKKISHYDVLAKLIFAKLQGKLTKASIKNLNELVTQIKPLETQVLPGSINAEKEQSVSLELQRSQVDLSNEDELTATQIDIGLKNAESLSEDELTKTQIDRSLSEAQKIEDKTPLPEEEFTRPYMPNEKTVVFEQGQKQKEKLKTQKKEHSKVVLMGILLGILIYVFFLDENTEPKKEIQITIIKPKLPYEINETSDPKKSEEFYLKAINHYLLDHVTGYQKASELLLASIGADFNNIKAIALLASCYINLVDSSNKDENYFLIISKLIELSRNKSLDLVEGVVVDVEFYILVGQSEAAQQRILDFIKSQRSIPVEMYYYIAFAYYNRGDYTTAAKYLGQIPDQKINTSKIYYLRGLVAEKLNAQSDAISEYKKAINFNQNHVKSMVKLTEVLDGSGRLKEASPLLQFITTHSELLSKNDLAKTFYYFSKLKKELENLPDALKDIETALKLDPNNNTYLLEYYTIRIQQGESNEAFQNQARMFHFLKEGSRLLKEGKEQEALTSFLQARQFDESSPQPLVRIGDMFHRLNDVTSELSNYRKAAKRAPKSVNIWSKYAEALISNFEWEEAQKAINHLRTLPNTVSTMDMLSGKLYARQDRYIEALGYYKKAMSRETINPDVYMSYADALVSTKNYKDAPFFYALARRFDPLNMDAVVGTANAIAQSDSINKALHFLSDEIKKSSPPHPKLFVAQAELEIQKGGWLSAQQLVNQAISLNPDFADSYKVKAKILLNKLEGLRKNSFEAKQTLDAALLAFQSYSDRKPSDPSGYFERFRILAESKRYSEAELELDKVYSVFPKHPGLHLLKGNLYLVNGLNEEALKEYQLEVKNNPNNWEAKIALGKSLIDQSRTQEAQEEFIKAMQLAPQSAEAKHMAGYASFLLKNYQGAIALYQAAISIDSGNPLIYKRLGYAYKVIGDYKGATEAFKKYIQLAPDAPDRDQFKAFQ